MHGEHTVINLRDVVSLNTKDGSRLCIYSLQLLQPCYALLAQLCVWCRAGYASSTTVHHYQVLALAS